MVTGWLEGVGPAHVQGTGPERLQHADVVETFRLRERRAHLSRRPPPAARPPPSTCRRGPASARLTRLLTAAPPWPSLTCDLGYPVLVLARPCPGGGHRLGDPVPPHGPARARWTACSAVRGGLRPPPPPLAARGHEDFTSATNPHSAKPHRPPTFPASRHPSPRLSPLNTQHVPHACGRSRGGEGSRGAARLPGPRRPRPAHPSAGDRRGEEGAEPGPARERAPRGHRCTEGHAFRAAVGGDSACSRLEPSPLGKWGLCVRAFAAIVFSRLAVIRAHGSRAAPTA